MKKSSPIPFLLLVFAACSGDAQDARNPQGSQAMVTSQDFSALYVASADDDTVTKVDIASGQAVSVSVPGEPTRVARVGDRVLVTLRARRAILELVDDGGMLVPGREIAVGAEPVGVAASEDGTRVFVAVSMTGQVLELDGASLDTLRVWELPDEPRWLALHHSRPALYVACARNGSFFVIDLDSGAVERVTFPTGEGFDRETTQPVPLTPRITGDPTVAPNGEFVAVPMLFVDNHSKIREPREGEMPDPFSTGYESRTNPTVAVVPADVDGTPEPGAIELVRISTGEVSGYAASVSVTPDSKWVVAPIEGSEAVFFFDVETEETFPPVGNIGFRPSAYLTAETGPRSVAFVDDDRGFVYSFIDRTTSEFSIEDVTKGIDDAMVRDTVFPDFTAAYTSNAVRVAESKLPRDVEVGRRLFYSTNDRSVAQPGGGVSCATCHFEGRTDGLSWNFDRGRRQTPSLAGKVSDREPVRWQGDRATVAEDAMATSQGLMGGRGLTDEAARQLAAFIDYTRAVDLPSRGVEDAQIALGREIFQRPAIGCASCHSGAIYSDGQLYGMLGVDGVKTPSLLGVAATPPYFHDGSASTLRMVLEVARSGAMGDTSSLTDAEMDALEAFLESL